MGAGTLLDSLFGGENVCFVFPEAKHSTGNVIPQRKLTGGTKRDWMTGDHKITNFFCS